MHDEPLPARVPLWLLSMSPKVDKVIGIHTDKETRHVMRPDDFDFNLAVGLVKRPKDGGAFFHSLNLHRRSASRKLANPSSPASHAALWLNKLTGQPRSIVASFAVAMKFPVSIVVLLTCVAFQAFAGTVEEYAQRIAPLVDPAKLATLGTRAANPRVQKYVYWLATAKQEQLQPAQVAAAAVKLAGYTNAQAIELTKKAMLTNLGIAQKFGCLDREGLDEMRRGNAATVRLGPNKGDQLSVDHVIPCSVRPELDCVIANLELMPLRMNSKKNARVGQRQRALANQLVAAGLMSSRSADALSPKRGLFGWR